MHLTEPYLGIKQESILAKIFGVPILFSELCALQLNDSAMVLRGLVKLYQMGEMEEKSKRNKSLHSAGQSSFSWNSHLITGTTSCKFSQRKQKCLLRENLT